MRFAEVQRRLLQCRFEAVDHYAVYPPKRNRKQHQQISGIKIQPEGVVYTALKHHNQSAAERQKNSKYPAGSHFLLINNKSQCHRNGRSHRINQIDIDGERGLRCFVLQCIIDRDAKQCQNGYAVGMLLQINPRRGNIAVHHCRNDNPRARPAEDAHYNRRDLCRICACNRRINRPEKYPCEQT
ncbi:hypothetical protein CHS0354_035310 [Potamilus streckersoni]|uniref:Uncharacterized protein n=1 Tax=Potamilus streckersoni TaxID=2493646 RepID=A0AAE0S2Z5_9BIVA|nr:hypothetical protein CHS0354_035310 [Potamilus streckersoni]